MSYINCLLSSQQVTFIEALDQLMPGFDPEIGKLAQRILINPRKIDYFTGVFANKVILVADSDYFFLRVSCFVSGLFHYFSVYVFLSLLDYSSKGWQACTNRAD